MTETVIVVLVLLVVVLIVILVFAAKQSRDINDLKDVVRDLTDWKAWHPHTDLDMKRARELAVAHHRATVRGQATEHTFWLRPDSGVSLHPKDAKFLGQPIDYVVFDGLFEERADINVIFLEVKTGGSSLTPRERLVRNAVEAGRVQWKTLTLDGVEVRPPEVEIDFSKVTATLVDPEEDEGIDEDDGD